MKLSEITEYHIHIFWIFLFVVIIIAIVLVLISIMELFELPKEEKDKLINNLSEEDKKEMIEIKDTNSSFIVSTERMSELQWKEAKYDKLKKKYNKLKQKYNDTKDDLNMASDIIELLINNLKEKEFEESSNDTNGLIEY